MCVFGGENKGREVYRGGDNKEASTELEGFCLLQPGEQNVPLKAGPRGSQLCQYQSELYLHVDCKGMQCKHVSGSVSN